MDKEGVLKIHIDGKSEGKDNNKKLSPSNFDISELIQLLTQIENLLSPINTENSLITYKLKSGSIANEIHTEDITVLERLQHIFKNRNINNTFKAVNTKQADAINYFQEMSKKKDRNIKITNSVDPAFELNITPETNYRAEEELYVDTELTLYGVITYIGGKNSSSIHLDTEEYGVVTVYTKDYVLRSIKKNMIYQEVAMNVSCRQSVYSYKLRDLNLISFVDYSSEYNKEYLDKLIAIGTDRWKDVDDTDAWLRDLRGIDE